MGHTLNKDATKTNPLDNLSNINILGFNKEGDNLPRKYPGEDLKTILTNLITDQSDIQTATVDISSAQILTLGSNGVELLPSPGTGKYYDVSSIILEIQGTVNYTVASDSYVYTDGNLTSVVSAPDLLSGYAGLDEQKAFAKMVVTPYTITTSDNVPRLSTSTNNRALELYYYSDTSGGDPTLGNGTMRAIIKYSIRTFGI